MAGMVPLTLFSAYALRPKKQEAVEGDEYIDEGKEDSKYVDEDRGNEHKELTTAERIRARRQSRKTW